MYPKSLINGLKFILPLLAVVCVSYITATSSYSHEQKQYNKIILALSNYEDAGMILLYGWKNKDYKNEINNQMEEQNRVFNYLTAKARLVMCLYEAGLHLTDKSKLSGLYSWLNQQEITTLKKQSVDGWSSQIDRNFTRLFK